MSTKIKTWQQRCRAHLDRKGVVTLSMIHKRMSEEIDDLRAEVKRLRADAERWKYLKERVEYYDGFACFPDVWVARPHLDSTPYDMLDAAVDAAMAEGEQLPTPPPGCKTEAEKTAYAFGFWSGVAAAKKEGER